MSYDQTNMNAEYQIGAWTDLFYKWKPPLSVMLVLMSENLGLFWCQKIFHICTFTTIWLSKKNDFGSGRFYNSMALDPQNKEIVFFSVSQQYGYPKKMIFFLKIYFFFSFTTVWLLPLKTRKLYFFFPFYNSMVITKNKKKKNYFFLFYNSMVLTKKWQKKTCFWSKIECMVRLDWIFQKGLPRVSG